MTDHRTPDPDSRDGQVDWDALARYLAGESSADEAEATRRWLDARPDRAELLAALERPLSRLAYRPPPDLDVEGALRRVHANMSEPAPTSVFSRATVGRRRNWTGIGLRVAAGLVAIALGSAVLWRSAREGRDTQTAPPRTFTTAIGERDSLRLPDGTRVVLGPGSRLAIDEGFGRTHREVGLRGEAYFRAEHRGSHPFTVRAGNGLVRDVGTEFAVHSDPGDGVRVVVTSGAVVLRGNVPSDSGVTLRQGDRGVLQPGGHVVAERGTVTEDDLAWTRGRLVFRDAPLAQVGADLRRWYGIELRVSDSSLAGKHVTTTFEGESPQRVLEVLAIILGADIDRHGDTTVLRARGARTRR